VCDIKLVELDDLDHGIINILKKDARTPYTKIAEKFDVSDATIHFRVKKLEEAGVIKNYTIVIDYAKVGSTLEAFVLLSVEPGKLENVSQSLVQIKDVIELHEIHGPYEILLKLRGETISMIRNMLTEKIRKIAGVVRTEILVVFKTWKEL